MSSTIFPWALGVIFSGTVIYAGMTWLLCLVAQKKSTFAKKEKRKVAGCLAMGNAMVIIAVCEMENRLGFFPEENRFFRMGTEGILLSLLAGGLLAAACMDAENCYVYNYVWWWCLLWTGILWGISVGEQITDSSRWGSIAGRNGIRQVAAVVFFVLLQQYLFAGMYGRADSHAFSVCALAGCHWQGDMLWFLVHMLLAVILLAMVQLLKGNVTCRGKLRTPKPFIPYIIITFWAEILWMLCLRDGLTHLTHIYA